MSMSTPDNQEVDVLLDKIARTATATSAWFQTGRDHFKRSTIVQLGAHTDGTHILTFEVSNDGSAVLKVLDATELDDEDGALTTNTITVTDGSRDDTLIEIGILHFAEFFRVVDTVSGGPATGLVSGVELISSGKRDAGGAGSPTTTPDLFRNDPVITG